MIKQWKKRTILPFVIKNIPFIDIHIPFIFFYIAFDVLLNSKKAR